MRAWIAAVCSVVLMGAGAVLVAPVAANALAGINWGSAFKHEIQPRADKRYYTKKQATKIFAAHPTLIRGTFDVSGAATGVGQFLTSSISFGVTLKADPTIHYINAGDPVPAGCSGTAQKPGAAPGNLCVFEVLSINTVARGTYDPFTTNGAFASANPLGITVFGQSAAAGQVFSWGTWVLHTKGLSKGPVPTSKAAHTGARGVR
jgi:hypothetical protein